MKKNIHFFDQGEANVEAADPRKDRHPGTPGNGACRPRSPHPSRIHHRCGCLPPTWGISTSGARCGPGWIAWQSSRERRFGDVDNPMLVKIVISPNLVIASYPDPAQLRSHREDTSRVQPLRGRELRLARACSSSPAGAWRSRWPSPSWRSKEKDVKTLKQAIKDLGRGAELRAWTRKSARRAPARYMKPCFPRAISRIRSTSWRSP